MKLFGRSKGENYFKHPSRARQAFDFSKLLYGENKSAMDIDGYIDWRAKRVDFFFEMKYLDAPMPDGQRYGYEHLVKDGRVAGMESYALVCEHDVVNPQEVVDASTTRIREYFDGKEWHKLNGCTCKEFTDDMWVKHGGTLAYQT